MNIMSKRNMIRNEIKYIYDTIDMDKNDKLS